MGSTKINPSDLMATGSFRGGVVSKGRADNEGLRRWLSEELTGEVARTKETGEPLDQAKVESLIVKGLLVDLSDLMSAQGRAYNHGLVNEKLKAFAAWRGATMRGVGKGRAGEADDLTDAEKAALAAKAK